MSQRPRPFVLTSSNYGPMIVNFLDRNTLPDGRFYGVGHQILSTGEFDPGEIELVLKQLDDLLRIKGQGVVAIDCGANVGVHTLAMAQFLYGQGSVVSFEAQRLLYYALCGNVSLANLFNVHANCSAVGAECGTMRVPAPDYTKSGSFGSLELKFSKGTEFIGQAVSYLPRDMQEVNVVSLDSLRLPCVDFIKIDVEGMELEVLQGARETIESHHPRMLIEWVKSDRPALEDFLFSHDYFFEEFGMSLLCV